jgi:hypothetical protein
MDAYSGLRELVVSTMETWKSGTIALTRTTNAAPDPETPWTQGAPTTVVYDLDAVVRGASAEFIDGTTIVASDLMVVASPIARLAGVPTAIVPIMSDTLKIDGETKAIKAIKPAPASGPAAVFRIFVAS